MSQSTKRVLSTIAIVIASVAFGILISADLGLMRKSKAQTTTTATGAPVSSVTIPSFADVASRVMPAVVSIRSTEIVHASERRQFGIDPFEFFFPDPQNPNRPRNPHQQQQPGEGDDERRQESGGSGFIISPDGEILTNNHVIEGATRVQVHYGADENGNGGRTVEAKIIGRDPSTDLALLKIDTDQQLPFIRLGDSDRIRKGDWAIAIGHPFQFENTLTIGVISAKGRALGLSRETSSFENFIQTDAAINFGNSGGPLLNIAGEVVGINTAIRGGATGIGFATPINIAKTLLPQLKQGKVVRGYLGMSISDVTEEIREAFDLPEARGALVQSVEADKPAARAGIKQGDVIVQVDDKTIRNNRELIDYISYLPVGSEVKITLLRNGHRETVTAKTAKRPLESEGDEEEAAASPSEPVRNKLGLSVQNLTGDTREQYNLPSNLSGVLVTSVKNVSPAGEANISEGDVISEVQGIKVNNIDDFRGIIDRLRSGQRVRMYVTTPTRTGAPISTYRILQVP